MRSWAELWLYSWIISDIWNERQGHFCTLKSRLECEIALDPFNRLHLITCLLNCPLCLIARGGWAGLGWVGLTWVGLGWKERKGKGGKFLDGEGAGFKYFLEHAKCRSWFRAIVHLLLSESLDGWFHVWIQGNNCFGLCLVPKVNEPPWELSHRNLGKDWSVPRTD